MVSDAPLYVLLDVFISAADGKYFQFVLAII